MRKSIRAIAVAVVFAALLLPSSPASAGELSAKLRAAINVKILSFDNSLRARRGSSVVIGVVYEAGDSESNADAAEMARQLEILARRVKLHGKRMRVVTLATGSDLDQRIRSAGVSAAYVVPGVQSVEEIARAATRANVPTICGTRRFLSRGLAIAVVERSGKPAIIVHLRHAKRSGMMLDPKLLRLAEIIR